MGSLEEFQHDEVLNNTYGVERRITDGEFNDRFIPLKNGDTLRDGKVNIAEFYSESAHQNVYVAYSKPAKYNNEGKNFELIDLVVEGAFGESQEAVLERFRAQVAFAEEYRKMSQEYAKKEILPILTSLPQLNCVYGRGDIFDKERVPSADLTHSSDIDLMLFVDPLDENDLEKYTQTLENYVATHPEVAFHFNSYKVVNTKVESGYGYGRKVISSNSTENTINDPIIVSIDVMQIDPLIELAKNASHAKLKKLLNPYVTHSLTTGGEILWSSDGADKYSSDEVTVENYKDPLPKVIQLKQLVNKFDADDAILEEGAKDLNSFDASWETK